MNRGITSIIERNNFFKKIFSKFLVKTFQVYHNYLQPKDFIVTGIPRNDKSFMSTLLCQPKYYYCLNEIFYKVETLPILFKNLKIRFKKRKLITAKPDKREELIINAKNGEEIDNKFYN